MINLSNWIYIDEVINESITNNIKSIHTDSRDFYIVFSKNDEFNDKANHSKIELRQMRARVSQTLKKTDKDDYLIHKDEILPFLKEVESITGGKAEWRCITFEDNLPKDIYPKGYNGWFKYLRFFRVKDSDYFVLCADPSNFYPVKWKKLFTKENIVERLLATH